MESVWLSGGGFFLNKSLASYQDTKKFNVIEGTVKYEGSGDVYIAAYIDGVQTSIFPDQKDYKFKNAECTNEAIINFDTLNWKASVTEVTQPKTKCNIYFEAKPLYDNQIYQMMVRLEEDGNSNLAYDGTKEESNLRYIGANPNNYVTFNGEEWRIIGSFKDIDDGTGRTEWRTKIIRTTYSTNFGWDAADVNDWNTADIKDELNSSYLNELSVDAQKMVDYAKWNIGKAAYGVTTANYYNQERSGATWTGKMGLMYPSDYGYAVGGDSRSACLNYTMDTWATHSECKENDWIIYNNSHWTITGNSSTSNRVLTVRYDGKLGDEFARSSTFTIAIRPVLYLSSNVKILNGSGTSADPYQLTI